MAWRKMAATQFLPLASPALAMEYHIEDAQIGLGSLTAQKLRSQRQRFRARGQEKNKCMSDSSSEKTTLWRAGTS